MIPTTRLLRAAAVALSVSAALQAQVTETPVAFDSAGRIRALTPALVTRLGLTAPAWPVEGAFREARLFALSSGGRVLAVERQGGAVDRYVLDLDGAALRAAIDAAVQRTGFIATEERADEVSQSARGHFIRRQLALSWFLYGPLLASLVDNDDGAAAIALAAVPAGFFIVQRVSRDVQVTRAQSSLSFDGALRGWATGAGLLYVLGDVEGDEKGSRAVGLASALGGSILGFKRGRSLTDGEAEASMTLSNLAALTGFGVVLSSVNNDSVSGRAVVSALLATGIPAYVLGPRYARQSGFAVTAGDVKLLSLGATLGVMTALIPVLDSNTHAQTGYAAATTGLVAGTLLMHLTWVRSYDHTTSEANLTSLGASAGALAGGAVVILAEPGQRGTLSLFTAGAILGGIAGHRVANPERAGARRVGNRGAEIETRLSSLALAAAGVPGRHAALTIRF